MKEILIKIVVDNDKVGSVINSKGFSKSVLGQFEILGLLENLVDIHKRNIKSLQKKTNLK